MIIHVRGESLGQGYYIHVYMYIPYSGLFSWVQIFVKCWRWPSELIFVVLKFRTYAREAAHARTRV